MSTATQQGPRSASAAPVTIDGVTVYRPTSTGRRAPVISDLSLDIPAGCHLALLGPNGAGKTSLLLALVGALPFDGDILVGAQRVRGDAVDAIAQSIGFVFAEPSDQLFCETVYDEVAFGPRQRGLGATDVGEAVTDALVKVGLEGYEAERPDELSLGEQRRLAVATALSTRPRAILCDEPTAALDPVARQHVIETLRSVEATLILATHDLDAALELRSEAALLFAGRLVARGPASELLGNRNLLKKAGLAP